MNPQRLGELAELAQHPSESPRVREVVERFVAIETRQREAVRELATAAGTSPETLGLDEPPPVEARVDELCETLAACLSGDGWDVWCSEVVPASIAADLDVEGAREYAEMDSDEWAAARERIVEVMRAEDGVETAGYSDEQLIAAHVQATFGVGLAAWEEWVLGYSPEAAFEGVVVGVIEGNTEAVRAVRESL